MSTAEEARVHLDPTMPFEGWSGGVGVHGDADAPGFRTWSKSAVQVLVSVDLLLALGVSAAVFMVTGLSNPAPLQLAVVAIAMPLALIASLALGRCYDVALIEHGDESIRRMGRAVVAFLAVLAVGAFLFRWDQVRPSVMTTLPITFALLVMARIGLRLHLRRLRARGGARHRTLVLGTERACAEVVRRLTTAGGDAYDIVGVVTDAHRGPSVEGVPVVGTSSAIRQAVLETGTTSVIMASWSSMSREEVRRVSWQLAEIGVDFSVAPNLTDVAATRVTIHPVAGLSLLRVREPEFTGSRRIAKAVFDRSVASVSLVLLSPVFIIVMLATRLTSHGPSIYSQRRVGLGGREFTIYKFRSMYRDADDRRAELVLANMHADGPMFKAQADPRVTPLGRWIRRFSIDELPQLINVVLGQMSLVGPRPPLPEEAGTYDRTVGRRLLVLPGLTGLWQVSGRSDLTWEESVALDLQYVENWSIYLDITILFRTALAVLSSRGAY